MFHIFVENKIIVDHIRVELWLSLKNYFLEGFGSNLIFIRILILSAIFFKKSKQTFTKFLKTLKRNKKIRSRISLDCLYGFRQML